MGPAHGWPSASRPDGHSRVAEKAANWTRDSRKTGGRPWPDAPRRRVHLWPRYAMPLPGAALASPRLPLARARAGQREKSADQGKPPGTGPPRVALPRAVVVIRSQIASVKVEKSRCGSQSGVDREASGYLGKIERHGRRIKKPVSLGGVFEGRQDERNCVDAPACKVAQEVVLERDRAGRDRLQGAHSAPQQIQASRGRQCCYHIAEADNEKQAD